jgi:hypothetical protein
MKTLRSRRIVAKIIPLLLTALCNSAGIAAGETALSLQTAVERALAAYLSIQAAEKAPARVESLTTAVARLRQHPRHGGGGELPSPRPDEPEGD